jgi:hypothetical protein
MVRFKGAVNAEIIMHSSLGSFTEGFDALALIPGRGGPDEEYFGIV